VTNEQFMWGANSVLVVCLGFFIRNWMASIKEDLKKITDRIDEIEEEKVDAKTCEIFHEQITAKLHTHAHVGQAGEVVR